MHISLLSHECCMARTSQSSCSYHPNMWWAISIMKFPVMQFSPASVTSSFYSQVFSSQPCSQTSPAHVLCLMWKTKLETLIATSCTLESKKVNLPLCH
jgi:hypothetical protein